MVTTMTVYGPDGRCRQHQIPDQYDRQTGPKIEKQALLGLDLGQRQDYTALAHVERTQIDREPATYAVRRLRRWRDVAYTTIRDELSERLTAWELARTDTLVLDATGVGVAVTDLFTEAQRASKLPVALSAITITGGNDASQVTGGWHVPKRDLIAVVAVLLEQRRLQVAAGLAEGDTLRAELGNFRTKITAVGNDTYSAWREADHDDLVLAVALACWFGEKPKRPVYLY